VSTFSVRRARRGDLPVIVGMLADDHLGATRESVDDLSPYEAAFAVIDSDPHQYLAICEADGHIAGTMQLTVIPGLSRKGLTRLLIEGVRVHRDARGSGIGSQMIAWAIGYAREQGCGMVQLTTDKSREDAHRFYERLGFEATHLGFKITLEDADGVPRGSSRGSRADDPMGSAPTQ
jgi:GNAT superfamily N-acetyltransferase